MKLTTLRTVFSGILLSFCLLGNANAAIIDQEQANTPVFMAAFSQSDLAQSFQQSSSMIAGAGIFLQAGQGTTDTVTISLWDALPNNAGSMLASASGLGTEGTWFDVFWNPLAVTPNTSLFLVFTSANDTLGIAGDTSNPYALGQTFANAGFGPFPSFDYAFRTYSSDDNAAPVSGPGTFVLFAFGVIALAIRKMKK
jgi:hypothetical protein